MRSATSPDIQKNLNTCFCQVALIQVVMELLHTPAICYLMVTIKIIKCVPWYGWFFCHRSRIEFEDGGDVIAVRDRNKSVDGSIRMSSKFASHLIICNVTVHLQRVHRQTLSAALLQFPPRVICKQLWATLLTYCALSSTQPLTLGGMGNE